MVPKESKNDENLMSFIPGELSAGFSIHELNRRIVDNAPISIIIINRRGTIVFINRFMSQMLDFKPKLGGNIFKSSFFIREKLCPGYKKLLSDGITFRRDGCMTKSESGEVKYLNIVAVPLKNGQGKVDGALSMAVDVTEIAKLNAELEQKVNERTLQLSEANEKLKSLLDSKMKFISDASHELRTPMSIIKLTINLLEEGEKSETYQSISTEIEKMTEILSDLTLVSSIEEGSEIIKLQEEVDLRALIGNVISRLKIIAHEKKIEIKCENCDSNIIVKGDRQKLEKLFLNIVRNAIKYGKGGGWIKIWSEKEKNAVLIHIQDNGIGIPKSEMPFIFDRFFRSSIAQKIKEGGFGLGLSICQWIAHQHNGTITAESQEGRGSTFTITLPLNK